MRVALDSNVMIYAEGSTDPARRDRAIEVIGAIAAIDLLIPVQAAGETLRWLVGKGGLSGEAAAQRAALWTAEYATQATDIAVFNAARLLVSNHGFQVWDAIILAASSEGGASVLLSEDMQDGFNWRGVTIANPFAANPSPAILDILGA